MQRLCNSLLILAGAGVLAGCPTPPMNVSPSISVTQSPGLLTISGSGFNSSSPCATLSLQGLPAPDGHVAIGQPQCTQGVFKSYPWPYYYVGVTCNPSVQKPATVFGVDTQYAALAAQNVTLPWGSDCLIAKQGRQSPITYTLEVFNVQSSGSLGPVQFSNYNLFLQFQGDTSNVFPFSVPATPGSQGAAGYEILAGMATVIISDPVGNILAQGTFLPNAGIYVSVDNTNNGIGFGALGVPSSNPNYPGQAGPAYPAAIIDPPVSVSNYNLADEYTSGDGGGAISCFGFPSGCPDTPPVALPTDHGTLFLNHFPLTAADFSARHQ